MTFFLTITDHHCLQILYPTNFLNIEGFLYTCKHIIPLSDTDNTQCNELRQLCYSVFTFLSYRYAMHTSRLIKEVKASSEETIQHTSSSLRTIKSLSRIAHAACHSGWPHSLVCLITQEEFVDLNESLARLTEVSDILFTILQCEQCSYCHMAHMMLAGTPF